MRVEPFYCHFYWLSLLQRIRHLGLLHKIVRLFQALREAFLAPLQCGLELALLSYL